MRAQSKQLHTSIIDPCNESWSFRCRHTDLSWDDDRPQDVPRTIIRIMLLRLSGWALPRDEYRPGHPCCRVHRGRKGHRRPEDDEPTQPEPYAVSHVHISSGGLEAGSNSARARCEFSLPKDGFALLPQFSPPSHAILSWVRKGFTS